MRRVLVVLAAAATTAVVAALPVSAAPIEGGQRVSWEATGPMSFTAPSCTTFPQLDQHAPDVRVAIAGWLGPLEGGGYPLPSSQEVWLDAKVTGSVSDSSGNVYTVSGHFVERDTRVFVGPLAVTFRGEGHLVITGPAGTYTGTATAITEIGPNAKSLIFGDMDVCATRG